MLDNKNNISAIVLLFFLSFYQTAFAALMDDLRNLQNAYPSFIKAISKQFIVCYDNSKIPVGNSFSSNSSQKLINPSLFDQIHRVSYPAGNLVHSTLYPPKTDPGRIRNAAFFGKMYGVSQKDVENKLVTIYWMEKVFGKNYPLNVTTVNHINVKFSELSSDLEKLPSRYYKYLSNPAGSFNWRTIAKTNQLSPHSYGISIDLNTQYANYWQWDLAAKNIAIREDAPLTYRNQIPWEIVLLFEKHGFIWGGKWYHYDTMHFEYRPELLRMNLSL